MEDHGGAKLLEHQGMAGLGVGEGKDQTRGMERWRGLVLWRCEPWEDWELRGAEKYRQIHRHCCCEETLGLGAKHKR